MAESIIKMTDGVIRQQKNTILKNVNIDIKSGEFVYLIGKVGSGKSSLLKTLYAELSLEFGNAEVAGFQLKKIKKAQIPLLRRKCGIVFQDFKLLIDRNVYENLEFVLRATGWKSKKAIKERIETVLTKVGMTDKQIKMPHQLSGGEQQRIVLARALLNAPPLILADEPTGNIDPETSYQLLELLKEICDTGKTIVIATHQYDLIQKYPGRVFCCENGELFEKTKNTECACVDKTNEQEAALPEIQEVIPVFADQVLPVPIQTEEENPTQDETSSEEAITDNITIPEIISTEEDAPVEVNETSEPEEIVQTTEENPIPANESPEPADSADQAFRPLLGKLEYPEITAFDYETEKLPVIHPEEKLPEVEAKAPITPETKEKKTATPPSPKTEEEDQQNALPAFDLELID